MATVWSGYRYRDYGKQELDHLWLHLGKPRVCQICELNNVCEGEGAVPNSTTIPAPQNEGPLLVEFNSTWNGHSPKCDLDLNLNSNLKTNLNVICKGKRKRS